MTSQEIKTIDRVRKLLAIADDGAASDAEIQTCIMHAKRIMDANHLTEADLAHGPEDDKAKVDAADFNTFRSGLGGKVYYWESILALAVEKMVGVCCYIDGNKKLIRNVRGITQFDAKGEPRYGKGVVFYGVAEDARNAVELYDELRLLIAAMATARFGSVYMGDGGTYSQGFVQGLFDTIEKEGESSKQKALVDASQNPNALVLIERRDELVQYKKDEGRKWLRKEKGIKLRKGQGSDGASGSNKAFSAGRSDGRATDAKATRRKKLA